MTMIIGYLPPGYLVLSGMKSAAGFPSVQFSLPYYKIWARRDRDKNEGGLMEFFKKDLICKKLKIIWAEMAVF